VSRRFVASAQLVKEYVALFINRRAYTVQTSRPNPENGRHYYYRPREKGSGEPVWLTDRTISAHLEGRITIGLYAINPSDQRCKWVAIDADYKNAMDDLIKLQYRLTTDHVDSALEMSRRGGHLWIFLAAPLLARQCRIYIYDLAGRLGVPVKGTGLADGIEVFPKHDSIPAGAFGNAIRGPLGIHRGAGRRFWFYGADYTLEAQIEYLKRLRKLSEDELTRFTVGKDLPAEIRKATSRAPQIREQNALRKPTFCILDYVGKTRIVGKNYVTRCPSCAQAGRDRGGDNLAILVSDPRFYLCWAGCAKEMIRAAVGHPIPVRQPA
jgi:TOTE conflict system, Archaeo-Eukaryotic Primase domain